MLIPSPRYSPEDFALWREQEQTDLILAQTQRMTQLEGRALDALRSFAEGGSFFVGISWGKDSVVVGHLAYRLRTEVSLELIWFPAGRIENPDCVLVRDAFLSRWPLPYREIDAGPDGAIGDLHGHDGAQKEFERASRLAGPRYASGVRAAEAGIRKKRMRHWGECSPNTCAPIGWWPTSYVFAYLAKYELPVHPMYACTMGGLYDREHLRVSTLGGRRGREHGRFEHERHYYKRELIELGIYAPENLTGIHEREHHG